MTYITGKILPDLDAVACAIAYANYLTKKNPKETYEPIFQEDIIFEAKFVLESLKITPNIYLKTTKLEEANYIMVDFSASAGLPGFVIPDKVSEVIDHRDFPEYELFKNSKWRVDRVGAAATIIAEFFYFDKTVSLDPITATLLLCAIYSNTVNFKSSNTTFRDLRMRDWLTSVCDDSSLPRLMLEYKSDYIINNLEKVLLEEKKTNTFQNGQTFSLYQIETSKTEAILANRAEIVKRLAVMDPLIRYNYLLIQDEKNGKTDIISNDQLQSDAFLRVGLSGKSVEDYWEVDKIMMRKQLIPYFKTMR